MPNEINKNPEWDLTIITIVASYGKEYQKNKNSERSSTIKTKKVQLPYKSYTFLNRTVPHQV